MNPEVKNLLSVYRQRKTLIKQRLADFKKIRKQDRERLFAELCFCLCTPQSKAVNCNEAVCRLQKSGALFEGSDKQIAGHLKGLVRFHNNKARYIAEARKIFCQAEGRYTLPLRNPPVEIRLWLVKNIKGLGLKEASHFLRNIGFGDGLAIIDRHVLANLKKYRAIKEIPQHISDKKYLELEEDMRRFSRKTGIPLAEMDLLFWSNQTGHVFK